MPWKTPMGSIYTSVKKQIPTLSIFGRNDPLEGFMNEFTDYHGGFKGYFDEFIHEGQHEVPVITKQLRTKIIALLQFSGVECFLKNDMK